MAKNQVSPLRRNRILAMVCVCHAVGFSAVTSAAVVASQPAWIVQSNKYTQLLLNVRMQHSPESGSYQGLAEYDAKIGQPTLADEAAERTERDAVAARIKNQLRLEKDRDVAEDLQILIHAVDLEDRDEDYANRREVPFFNADEQVFGGLVLLLDEQIAPQRREAAIKRLNKYAGLEPGFLPLTDLLQTRMQQQIAKPGISYPAKADIETQLGRNANYLEGIPQLFIKFHLGGWEDAYAKLKEQLIAYDTWVRQSLLPKAREDFRLPVERYRLNLERYGIDVASSEISAMAHAAFSEYQSEMHPIAAAIAQRRGLPSSDYRDVIAALKKEQVVGDAIIPLYERRLSEIEAIIAKHGIVSLPRRSPVIRLASAAETAQSPAPHMQGLAFLNNTGERGQFVLPLNFPRRTAARQKNTMTSPSTRPHGL